MPSATQSARRGRDGAAAIWPVPPRAVMASPISSARRSATVMPAASRSTNSPSQRRRRAVPSGSTGRGRSRRAEYSRRNSSISIGKARNASASATAHSSTGMRSIRNGRPRAAMAGATSATLVVHDTNAPNAIRTTDNAVNRRNFSSPPTSRSVDHRCSTGSPPPRVAVTQPSNTRNHSHRGTEGSAPPGMRASHTVTAANAAIRPIAAQPG